MPSIRPATRIRPPSTRTSCRLCSISSPTAQSTLPGLSAAIRPIALQMQTLRLDLPAMALSGILLFVFCLDGALTVVEGAVLLGLAVLYTVLLIGQARRENRIVIDEFASEYPAEQPGNLVLHLVFLTAGLAIIVIGADMLVRGAVEMAVDFGVSEALIGLTVVAVGTSAPEFATTIVSTIRGERDIAIGNLIGSSTYNLTFILGASLLFATGPVGIDRELITVDLPVMVATVLLCIPVFKTGRRVTRPEGVFFVLAYAAYLTYLLIART